MAQVGTRLRAASGPRSAWFSRGRSSSFPGAGGMELGTLRGIHGAPSGNAKVQLAAAPETVCELLVGS